VRGRRKLRHFHSKYANQGMQYETQLYSTNFPRHLCLQPQKIGFSSLLIFTPSIELNLTIHGAANSLFVNNLPLSGTCRHTSILMVSSGIYQSPLSLCPCCLHFCGQSRRGFFLRFLFCSCAYSSTNSLSSIQLLSTVIDCFQLAFGLALTENDFSRSVTSHLRLPYDVLISV